MMIAATAVSRRAQFGAERGSWSSAIAEVEIEVRRRAVLSLIPLCYLLEVWVSICLFIVGCDGYLVLFMQGDTFKINAIWGQVWKIFHKCLGVSVFSCRMSTLFDLLRICHHIFANDQSHFPARFTSQHKRQYEKKNKKNEVKRHENESRSARRSAAPRTTSVTHEGPAPTA